MVPSNSFLDEWKRSVSNEFSTSSMDKPTTTSKHFPVYSGGHQLRYLNTKFLLNDTAVWQTEVDIEWIHWLQNECGTWKI